MLWYCGCRDAVPSHNRAGRDRAARLRPVNLLASTDQWHGQEPYGWARSNRVFDREEFDRRGFKDSWIEAGDAMHAAVVGEKTARQALDDAAPAITEYARR